MYTRYIYFKLSCEYIVEIDIAVFVSCSVQDNKVKNNTAYNLCVHEVKTAMLISLQ